MKVRTIYRPARLLWLLPIFYLQFKFENLMTGMFFGIALAWFTSKIFPLAEFVKTEEQNDEQPKA